MRTLRGIQKGIQQKSRKSLIVSIPSKPNPRNLSERLLVKKNFHQLFMALTLLTLSTLNLPLSTCLAFEGRINATITQGNQSQTLLYTVGTNFLRVEITGNNLPNPVDILDRNSGALTMLFPHNRSFMHLKSTSENATAPFPAMPLPPGNLPPGVGPTTPPGMPGSLPMPSAPSAPPGAPARPQMPVMPNMPTAGGMPAMPPMPMMAEPLELKATGAKTNLLGFACEQYEIKQRGETMEIWATSQLLPFQKYVLNQPNRFGPRMIEEQWATFVTAKKLFPLLVSLHLENGVDRYRFEVQSVTPQHLTEEDMKLFQPPDGYFEIQPLPF